MKSKKTGKKYQFTILLLCVSLIFPFCFSACGSRATEKYTKTGTYFDTVISITLYDKDKVSCMDTCFEIAARYEKLFSRTMEDSDVSRINQADGEFVTVDPETITLIEYGLKYGKLSEGKFDITIGSLSDLWNISDNPGIVPDSQDIEKARETVDYRNLKIDGNQVALQQKGAKLDLGGIAKGYIADRMKDYLKEEGVTSATINLGGNVLTIGTKPDGSNYNIAVQKPFAKMNESLAALEISDQTVVSSGIYERYFKVEEKIYHHILDPKTGYPVENNLLGVTIICDQSVDGDGLSTSCFSLGLEKGMELIESLDNTEAVFITNDYVLHTSSGIGDKIPMKVQ